MGAMMLDKIGLCATAAIDARCAKLISHPQYLHRVACAGP